MLTNLVPGYEDIVLFWGKNAVLSDDVDSVHYLMADALVRKGDFAGALDQLVLGGRAKRYDAAVRRRDHTCEDSEELRDAVLRDLVHDQRITGETIATVLTAFPHATQWMAPPGASQESRPTPEKARPQPTAGRPAAGGRILDEQPAIVRNAALEPDGNEWVLDNPTPQLGVALMPLKQPIRGAARFRFSVQSRRVGTRPKKDAKHDVWRNGAFVFGEGTELAGLVCCGIYLRDPQRLFIRAEGQEETKETAAGGPNDRITVTVSYDPRTSMAAVEAGGTTLRCRLATPIQVITHVGYGCLNARSAFSGIELLPPAE